jgi:hypothetical protein
MLLQKQYPVKQELYARPGQKDLGQIFLGGKLKIKRVNPINIFQNRLVMIVQSNSSIVDRSGIARST